MEKPGEFGGENVVKQIISMKAERKNVPKV